MGPVVWVTHSKNIVAKTYNLPFAVGKTPTPQANLALLIIPSDVLASLKCLELFIKLKNIFQDYFLNTAQMPRQGHISIP